MELRLWSWRKAVVEKGLDGLDLEGFRWFGKDPELLLALKTNI